MDERPLVLYIEDNELNRTLMRRVLENRGFRVEMAADGNEGLAAARTFKPALVLMDLGIPGTDGYETTRLIKADPELAGIPVVAVTAFAMTGDRERAMLAGCDGYFTKPIDVATFPREIQQYLRRTAAVSGDSLETKTPLGPGG